MSLLGLLIKRVIIPKVVGSALDHRKADIKKRLQDEIEHTDSPWGKKRNEALINVVDGASEKALDEIEKKL